MRREELDTLLDKLHYLSRVATFVVFSGSLPRDVEDDFYAEAMRDLSRRGVQCVLDSEGEPLRHGVDAEPFLVSPNQREAESLVGQEFSEDDDFLMALDAIADLGARNVLITQETVVLRRCSARTGRCAASAPRSRARAGRVRRCRRRSPCRLPRRAVQRAAVRPGAAAGVGCAAASVVELGPGRFDPREAVRLAASVELEELQPIRA